MALRIISHAVSLVEKVYYTHRLAGVTYRNNMLEKVCLFLFFSCCSFHLPLDFFGILHVIPEAHESVRGRGDHQMRCTVYLYTT